MFFLPGTTFLLAGDMRQTLPVVKRGTRSMILNATLLRSVMWRPSNWHIHHLTINMRVERLLQQGRDATPLRAFAAWLLRIGNGTDGMEVNLPPEMVLPSSDPVDLIDDIYGDLRDPLHRTRQHLQGRCIVSTKNYTINLLNDIMRGMLPGLEVLYQAVNTVRYCILSFLLGNIYLRHITSIVIL